MGTDRCLRYQQAPPSQVKCFHLFKVDLPSLKPRNTMSIILENETFLGEESGFTSDRVRAEQEYVRAGLIFGINRNVFIMSICAAFNSVIIGFNIGVFGEIVYILQDDMDLDMYECGILVGVLNFVAIFGSIVAGYTSDKFGRLKSFAAASILFFTGGIILVFSSSFTGLL